MDVCSINQWSTSSAIKGCKNKPLIHLSICVFHLNKILKSQGYRILTTKKHCDFINEDE
jgi:hypothetical protein